MNGEDIFRDDADRRGFLEAAGTVRSETPFSLLAYCLMGNHFHFAIQVAQNPLATVMQRLLTSYSRAFNRRHGREGHLFQARYKFYHCVDDRYLTALIRYIHRNPVRAGLCRHEGEWPWSSYQALTDRSVRPVLVDPALVHNLAGQAMDGVGGEEAFEPWPVSPRPSLLRSDPNRRSIGMVAAAIAGSTPPSALDAEQRCLVAREAVAEGHSLTDIARWMGYSVVSVHRWVRRR